MEFPEVGAHCSVPSCNALDFLPFKCQLCCETHCRQHCHPADHNCQHLPPQRTGSDSSSFAFSCHVSGCKGRELVEVLCPECAGNYCLQHRHPPDHACSSLLPQPPSKQELANQRVKAIADALPTKPSKKLGHKDPKLTAKVQLMKLKMRAKVIGSANMLPEERCHLLVLLPLGHAPSSVVVCVSHNWTVGRALDAIADLSKVPNNNSSRGNNGQLLQLFRHSCGSALLAAAQVSQLLRDDLLYDGDTVILATAAKGVTVLTDTHLYKLP